MPVLLYVFISRKVVLSANTIDIQIQFFWYAIQPFIYTFKFHFL